MDYRVEFQPGGAVCSVRKGTTLFEAALAAGVRIRTDCGGKGRCGKCVVEAGPVENLSSVTEAEIKVLGSEKIGEGVRLACQAEVLGPVSVTVFGDGRDERFVTGKSMVEEAFASDPMVCRSFLDPEKMVAGESLPGDVLSRVRARAFSGEGPKVWDVDAVRSLAKPESYSGELTLVVHDERGVTSVLPGRRERSLGVAVDVGTTTVALYLVDLDGGKVLSYSATANPQRRYGEDVVSRITYACENELGLEALQGLIAREIERLARQCLEEAGAAAGDVDEICVVGNTTMLQLLAGVHPYGLGIAPYLPVTSHLGNFRAGDLGIGLNPGMNVYLFPVVSGFVGGDALGTVLALRPQDSGEVTLIVDIGTNGELVLGGSGGLWATSCATGPALEGAHIDCGMRAVPGALDTVAVDPESLDVSYTVLGDGKAVRPRGLCGSGIIDAVAQMVKAGILLPTGRIREGLSGVTEDEKGVARRFMLVPGDRTETGDPVFVSLKDVRQIQLAKAALGTGIRFLMRRAGILHIDRMVLTGAFGARFNWRNAEAIGMLPPLEKGTRVEVVENAAGIGAIMALTNRIYRREAEALSGEIRFVELADEPDFNIEFPMAMTFPS